MRISQMRQEAARGEKFSTAEKRKEWILSKASAGRKSSLPEWNMGPLCQG